MRRISRSIASCVLLAAISLGFYVSAASRALARLSSSSGAQTSDAWSSSQTVSPEALAEEQRTADRAEQPMVVCVGFHTLYEGAHIPGAVFEGPGSAPQGIARLKTWAKDLPRSANIVLYCGCCPLEHCPNLAPAFVAMRKQGFTHLRVLLLPHDFNTDWIAKGYPIEKGK
jgi:thiosulfate/3-mercaptopyruvate sulfurtransferase